MCFPAPGNLPFLSPYRNLMMNFGWYWLIDTYGIVPGLGPKFQEQDEEDYFRRPGFCRILLLPVPLQVRITFLFFHPVTLYHISFG